MVVLALVVVLLAGMVARLLRGRCCGWYDARVERTCCSPVHRGLEHRHVWTDDERVVAYPLEQLQALGLSA
jgi:hypothetical protein